MMMGISVLAAEKGCKLAAFFRSCALGAVHVLRSPSTNRLTRVRRPALLSHLPECLRPIGSQSTPRRREGSSHPKRQAPCERHRNQYPLSSFFHLSPKHERIWPQIYSEPNAQTIASCSCAISRARSTRPRDCIGHADLAAAVLEQLRKLLCRERALGRRRYAHAGVKQRRERCRDAFVVLILQNADESNAL